MGYTEVGAPSWIGHGIKTCKYMTIETVKCFQTVMPLDPSGLTKAFYFFYMRLRNINIKYQLQEPLPFRRVMKKKRYTSFMTCIISRSVQELAIDKRATVGIEGITI